MIRLFFLCLSLLALINQSISQQDSADTDSSPSDESVDPPRNPSSGLPPVITGISGCTYQSINTTVNCPRPVTLTLTGSGFMTGLEDELYPSTKLIIMITGGRSVTDIIQCKVDGDSMLSDTVAFCTITQVGFGSVEAGALLDLELVNLVTFARTDLPKSVSFAVELAPRVDRISGCAYVSPDGRTTSQCDILHDHITLHGSGFTSVDYTYSLMSLGSSSRSIWMFNDQMFIVRYTDSQIVFNFGSSTLFIPAVEAQSGNLLPFSLADGQDLRIWSTQPVYIGFKALPAPVIRDVVLVRESGQGCFTDNSTGVTRYRDCVPGASYPLKLEGDYLFDGLTVTIGGRSSRVMSGTASSVYISMPVFQFTEGVFYDIVVTTISGSTVVPQMIEFNTDPVITNVVPCVDTGVTDQLVIPVRCRPTETLVLKVLNFKRTDVPQVVFLNVEDRVSTVLCENVALVDAETVTCVMPSVPGFKFTDVSIRWADNSTTSRVRVTDLWDPINSPRITSLSGCYSDSNDPLHLNQCLGQPTTDIVLTIHGVRLQNLPNGTWSVWIKQYSECSRPIAINENTLTCLLPMIGEVINPLHSLRFDVKYPVVVQGFVIDRWQSTNAGYLTFVQQESHPSSSVSTITIAVATIFSVLGAVLFAVCLIMTCRKSQMKQSIIRSASSDSDAVHEANSNNVELADV